MKSCLVVGLVVGIASSQAAPASAQEPELQPPALTPVLPQAAPRPAWQQRAARFDRVPGEVSESTAIGLSLGLTAVSWGLMYVSVKGESPEFFLLGAAGALVLPSAGHWYAGEAGGVGLVTRGAGLALFISGAIRAEREVDGCDGGCSTTDDAELRLWAGFGLFIAGTIYDIATSGSAARAHNERLRKMMVAPTVQPGGGGLALVGQF